jgi:hypothetical protein
MHDALTIYFNGEKYAGLILAGIAICAMVVSGLLFRAGAGFRSFTITLGMLALAEIALGVGLYARTGPQVRDLETQLQSDAASFYASEATRMGRVQRNFVLVEYVELAVIITAGLVALATKGRPTISGIALGLLINASVLLAFDVFAERRGAEYAAALVTTNR